MTRLINKADEGQLLKSHYRVSFNKDGSVISADRVEGPKNDRGGYIQYVQADSKEEAIARARKRLEAYERRKVGARERTSRFRANVLAAGRCLNCNKQPRATALHCRACADKINERKRLERAGELQRRKVAVTDAEKIAVHQRDLERCNQSARARAGRVREVFGSTHARAMSKARKEFARQCLSTYETMANQTGKDVPGFRRWLVAQIRDIESKEAAARPSQASAPVAAE